MMNGIARRCGNKSKDGKNKITAVMAVACPNQCKSV
jgi:hypothetical protein